MNPFYTDEFVTLYHGDCLELTQWTAADVLIMDPPYGTASGDKRGNDGYGRRQDRKGGGSRHAPSTPGIGAQIANDTNTEARDCALALWGDRPRLLFGSPRLPDPPGAWVDRLVWDKKRPGMNGGPWRYRHESIYVSAGFERTSDSAVSVLTCWPDQADHIHAKPLDLMCELVGAAPARVIADPFAGSGTTLVAAKRLGRISIGVELEERYCEIAAGRLSQDVLDFGAVVGGAQARGEK